MAEFYLTYGEISDLVDKCIAKSSNSNDLVKHRAEILAALTGKIEPDNQYEIAELISLWENQVSNPSQLLLGTRYIRMKDTMVPFIVAAFSSGFIDAVIAFSQSGAYTSFSIAACSSIAFALYEIFRAASTLGNNDFCVYLQAVNHYCAHQEFTMNELLGWFPQRDDGACNVSDCRWACEHLGGDKIRCEIKQSDIENALESLGAKGLLIVDIANQSYRFRY